MIALYVSMAEPWLCLGVTRVARHFRGSLYRVATSAALKNTEVDLPLLQAASTLPLLAGEQTQCNNMTCFLCDPAEIPPPIASHLTPVALFPVVSQTIAAAPPLLPVRLAYRNSKTGFGGRVSQKELASEAYRPKGGIA